MTSSVLAPHEIVVVSSGSQKAMSFEKGRIERDSWCFGLAQAGCRLAWVCYRPWLLMGWFAFWR